MPQVHCAHGCKKNAKGHTNHWIGYKLCLSTGDADVPLAAYLSGANLHDSRVLPSQGQPRRVHGESERSEQSDDASHVWCRCDERQDARFITPGDELRFIR
jgi:hypothetical protein